MITLAETLSESTSISTGLVLLLAGALTSGVWYAAIQLYTIKRDVHELKLDAKGKVSRPELTSLALRFKGANPHIIVPHPERPDSTIELRHTSALD